MAPKMKPTRHCHPAGDGADTLYGEAGNDQLLADGFGGTDGDVDTLYGGNGDDSMWGTTEQDSWTGGTGEDLWRGEVTEL